MSTTTEPITLDMCKQGMCFDAESIRAFRDGRKSQTRRIIKPQPPDDVIHDGWLNKGGNTEWATFNWDTDTIEELADSCEVKCPVKTGQWYYLRERFAEIDDEYGAPHMLYEDGASAHIGAEGVRGHEKYQLLYEPISQGLESDEWRNLLFMPKWAARFAYRIGEITVERVQDISFADCRAEGCSETWKEHVEDCGHAECTGVHCGEKWHFTNRWNALHGPVAWERNDWVWCFKKIDFTTIER